MSARYPRGRQESVYSGWARALEMPAVIIAANMAGLLSALTIVGLVPGMVSAAIAVEGRNGGDTRVVSSVLSDAARLLRRDAPISLALLVFAVFCSVNIYILTALPEGGTRVFLTALSVPPLWLIAASFTAYVAASFWGGFGASRRSVLIDAVKLLSLKPGKAALAPLVAAIISPLWILAPFTIAVGVSIPPWLVAKFWGGIPSPD